MSEDLRPLMFAIAYRMVGSVADAEDLVQEGYLRMAQALALGTVGVRDFLIERGWLSTTCARPGCAARPIPGPGCPSPWWSGSTRRPPRAPS